MVLAVRDGAHHLARSIDSILAQESVDLELVIVDDGSADTTPALLGEKAHADDRVRVLTQAPTGLTDALVAGCRAARGALIARHDAGDMSHPRRLFEQAALLRSRPEVVLVSCFTRFFAAGGETMGIAKVSGPELSRGLRATTAADLVGPSSHGSVMMRANAYRQVGGYRTCFRVAQDIDLWLRLRELGDADVVPELRYEAECSPTGITATRRRQQVASATIALAAAEARRRGVDEAVALERLGRVNARDEPTDRDRAAFLYFLGRSQIGINRCLARSYYRQALSRWPFHVRSAIAWASSWFGI